MAAQPANSEWTGLICGFFRDEESGRPEGGLPGKPRSYEISLNWIDQGRYARKEGFEMFKI
jgi:hypothetical protein